MSRKSYSSGKNRADGNGTFLAIPHAILNAPLYPNLSAHAIKLLADIGAQYNGKNNGDLCATWSLMKKRGWKSPDTLNKARKELLESGLIKVTRAGGRHMASLYALTWRPINFCGGKLDIPETVAAPGDWRKGMGAY
ncbi:hypothetical protein [Methylophaga thiooxydans]|uniref:hypothetical protein n=1 Tax=Methylophaga thiooxydans TaxID=392484 RepID=UPI0005648D8A|nr:hypothetical protein [Methylophaga thiooxydans]